MIDLATSRGGGFEGPCGAKTTQSGSSSWLNDLISGQVNIETLCPDDTYDSEFGGGGGYAEGEDPSGWSDRYGDYCYPTDDSPLPLKIPIYISGFTRNELIIDTDVPEYSQSVALFSDIDNTKERFLVRVDPITEIGGVYIAMYGYSSDDSTPDSGTTAIHIYCLVTSSRYGEGGGWDGDSENRIQITYGGIAQRGFTDYLPGEDWFGHALPDLMYNEVRTNYITTPDASKIKYGYGGTITFYPWTWDV